MLGAALDPLAGRVFETPGLTEYVNMNILRNRSQIVLTGN